MNNKEMLMLAAAAAVAFFILKKGGANGSVSALPVSQGGIADFVNGIFNSSTVGQPGFGWQYFSNGTAIDPAGNYYFQGQRVWTNQ